jgi:hypothetical protein
VHRELRRCAHPWLVLFPPTQQLAASRVRNRSAYCRAAPSAIAAQAKEEQMKDMGIFVLVVAVCAATSSIANASPTENYWSSVGGGCAPIDTTIQSNKFNIGAGGLRFFSTYVGTLTAVCPVTRNTGTSHQPNKIYLSYQDSAAGSGVKVEVKLEKMNLTTGAITQIATLSSDSGSVGDGRINVGFTHTFDWENYAYFFYADLTRSGTADSAILYAVSLDYN